MWRLQSSMGMVKRLPSGLFCIDRKDRNGSTLGHISINIDNLMNKENSSKKSSSSNPPGTGKST